MQRISRLLFLVAALIFVGGLATCWFGVQHEIAKIPPDVRARMSDTDWVGVEWVARGMTVCGFALGILIISIAIRAWLRSRSARG